ncbi:hypothetical protein IW15_11195 [Chryseobacterium soli]|uniref:Cytochrome C551 n=1 Tax=Chryseobacterium soli TaxID=445961 RepID=A0A086A616_9FLAO|nr:hypothetical protein [Chryseobacterium soli]KFF12130.1 hypothetical protein IW15_11195 [Chryseobacterium soli]
MKNIILSVLGLGFIVLSCTKKEKVIEKTNTNTIITDSTTTAAPAASSDTMKISHSDSTSHHLDSVKRSR